MQQHRSFTEQMNEVKLMSNQTKARNMQLETALKACEQELQRCQAEHVEAERVNIQIQSRLELELDHVASSEGEVGRVYKEINASLEEAVKVAYQSRDETERAKAVLQEEVACLQDELRYRRAENSQLLAAADQLKVVALEQSSSKNEVRTYLCSICAA